MSKYIDVAIGDESVLVVEVPAGSEPEVVEAGRIRDLSEQALTSFATTIDAARDTAATVVRRVRSMAAPPSELTIEFSIQLAAEAGVVIASTAATADMRVAFRWSKDDE